MHGDAIFRHISICNREARGSILLSQTPSQASSLHRIGHQYLTGLASWYDSVNKGALAGRVARCPDYITAAQIVDIRVVSLLAGHSSRKDKKPEQSGPPRVVKQAHAAKWLLQEL